MIGKTLGHYQVLEKLGAGGMGEVYRARDPRLGRDVALKVLPEAFARDPERMARFEREAQVLASLNHPNIAQLYGLEENALVMEYVPGDTGKRLYAGETAPETLAAVIHGEPAIPDAPPHLQHLLRRCLDKDPHTRLRDIGEARILLQRPPALTPPTPSHPRPRLLAPLAALGLVFAAVALWLWLRVPLPSPRPVNRWTTTLQGVGSGSLFLALSPDGSRLAYSHPDHRHRPRMAASSSTCGSSTSSTPGPSRAQTAPRVRSSPRTASGSAITPTANSRRFRSPAAGGTPQILVAPDLKKGESQCHRPRFLPGGKGSCSALGAVVHPRSGASRCCTSAPASAASWRKTAPMPAMSQPDTRSISAMDRCSPYPSICAGSGHRRRRTYPGGRVLARWGRPRHV
jgi:serine/threonine protein kinase